MLPGLGMIAGAQQVAQASRALSPRQQQAVRLLQLPSADYAQMLHQAACDNPFLEWAEGWGGPELGPDDAGGQGEGETDPAVDREADADAGELSPAADDTPPAAEPPHSLDDRLAQVPCGETLAAHLGSQLRLLRLPPRERLLALALVDCLEDDGYLRLPLAAVGQALGELRPAAAPHELALALARVQSLEPAGVGARNLAECLALQLRAVGLTGAAGAALQVPLALSIARDHLPALAARDVAGLARRLRQPLASVQAACERIRRLDPHPGWRIGPPPSGAVTPDVVVRRSQGQWVAQLNPAAMPRLRLHRAYAGWCAGHREQAGAALGRQLQEARWTLRNAEQRFATILSVARAILQRQHRFLALGPLAMRPLALREIAEAVGVHESTVSRATHQKYMATPCGLFELKFFFSRGLATDGGGQCSPTAVRGLIRQMVDAESPATPLSDVDLAHALAGQGLRVARRTVTKYRQQLRIEAAPRRVSGAVRS